MLVEIASLLNSVSTFDEAKKAIARLESDMARILGYLKKGVVEEQSPDVSSLLHDLENSLATLQKELAQVSEELRVIDNERQKEREQLRVAQERTRDIDFRLRTNQNEERDILLKLERLKF